MTGVSGAEQWKLSGESDVSRMAFLDRYTCLIVQTIQYMWKPSLPFKVFGC